jgi:hypothetical protein
VIKSFGARYAIQKDGSIDVIEDLLVDFGSQQKHGIFRDIDVLFEYDAHHQRKYDVKVTGVTNGETPVPYKVSTSGATKKITIGDADKLVSGEQRYVITYRLLGALNAFEDHDELYWNVTGDTWPVPIERVTVSVTAPAITAADCFQGPEGSTEKCQKGISPSRADYQSSRTLRSGEEVTIVAGLQKGSVQVSGPILVTKKSLGDQIRDVLGLTAGPIALAVVAAVVTVTGLARLWWTRGRDRWYGDVQYLSGRTVEEELPLGARETVVVEFAPPEVDSTRRALRPAEAGVLMDERADTLDVSATIVDLAVRGYLRIVEPERHKYTLQQLKEPDASLLPYESELLTALFGSAVAGPGEISAVSGLAPALATVNLDDLKDHFFKDLASVKKRLYEQAVKTDKMFPSNPETIRMLYAGAGVALAVAGGLITAGLGALGAGIAGIPVVLGGLALAGMSRAMPRRTASGREMYRRLLGFREFMVTAETERARFEEDAGIFEKYLPYAIVFRCTGKWAKAFEGLSRQPAQSGWYVSPNPFVPALFARDIGSFSSSVSSVMAATPSSSGSSGFGGGGFSGGGGGGGGGGSW